MTTADVAAAVAVLRAGGLVAFPTETVYGLGADAANPDAVRRVYRVKVEPEGSSPPPAVSSQPERAAGQRQLKADG